MASSSSSNRNSVTPLLAYYARQGLWGHLEHECNKMLQKGISDSSQLNWWRAIAQGFTAVASSATGQSRNVGEAIRELSSLKPKRDLELPCVVALVHFHKCAERLDVVEIENLEELAKREESRAAENSLLMAAQFHLFSALHGADHDLHLERLDMARRLITRVCPAESIAQTGMQRQAHLMLAWVEMSVRPTSRAEEEQRRAAIRYLGDAARDVEVLMAKAKYFEVIGQHRKAMDELHQCIAAQSTYTPALVEKAKILIVLGEWDQASEACQRVLQHNERHVEALRIQLLCDMTQTAMPQLAAVKAIGVLAKAMERYEAKNAPLYFSTARTIARLARRRKPVLEVVISELTRRALAIREDAGYTAELAHQMALTGDYPQAAATFRKAGESDESNLKALYGVIYCQLMTNELEDAGQQMEFLSAIGDSIQQDATLPLLKAILAWRTTQDPQQHAALLHEAETIHFKHLAESSCSSHDAVYDHFARLDPDFLLELAGEHLNHLELVAVEHFDFQEADEEAKDEDTATPAAVARGVVLLERLSGEAPGIVEAQLLVGEARFGLGQKEAAQRSVAAVLALDDSSSAAHLLQTRISLKQRNYRASRAALDAAVAADFGVRGKPVYLLASARLKCQEGDHDEALQELQQALKLPGVREGGGGGASSPEATRVAVFVDLASTLASLRQFEQAATTLAEAQERFRGSKAEVRVLMAQAELAVRRDDFEGAIRLLNGVPATSPAYVQAQVAKAGFYLQVRHDKRAYTQCYRDLVGYEQSAASYERLGAAYMRIQAPEAAIEAYEQAHHLDPRDARLAAKIGRALVSTHDYLKATDYYVTALQAHSDDVNLRHDLAKLFVKLSKFESAVQILTYALEPAGASTDLLKMIHDVKSLTLLAEVYTAASESSKKQSSSSSEISQTLMRGRELQKSVIEKCRREMASAQVLMDQRKSLCGICRSLSRHFAASSETEEKAVAYLEEAREADSTNKTVLMELARLQLKRGKADICEAHCLSLTRLEPRHEEASMLLADVYFLRQDYEDATLKLRQLLEAKPSHYSALSKLVLLLRRAGKLEDVEHYLRRAERHDLRALSHPGLNFCKGLHARSRNEVLEAVKFFNLARRDGRWGVPALMNMIEIYLNPDSETIWDDGTDTSENSEASLIADQLFRELNSFSRPDDLDERRVKVLGAYIKLATRTKLKVDEAMQIFIDILEAEKDYLPALLGLSTAFMLEKSQTKARNALKRVAKMPYSQDLADDFERGYLLLADIYIQKAKFDLAEDLCKRCLKYNQSCGRAWEVMGSIREKEASYKDAADMYEKAWKLEHEASAPVGFKLAFNYLKAKRFVEAIDICNRILSLYPDYPKIRKEILEKAIDALRP